MSRDNGGKVQYNTESSGHVHVTAPLILMKTIRVQSGYGNEEPSVPEVKHWSLSSQTFILL